MKKVLLWVVFVCLCISMSYASWKNPVFLSELNDFQNGYAASGAKISSDENLIIFSRSTPSKIDALWEALRNPDTGLFDQQRQLSELKFGGAQVYGSWISEDKLRLYYAGSDPQNLGGSKRPIWMAIRGSVDEPWQTIKRHTELEVEAFQTICTLTADEKTIMWETATFSTAGVKRIFTATRPSILHNFSNLREVEELEALQARVPIISQDGLTVYFRIRTSEGDEEWCGHRDSLELPFGNFALFEQINASGISVDPCLSKDGKRLYYFHRPGVFDINNTGIYVSEWVDDSYDDAVRNLQEATEKKQQAILLLTKATEHEQIASQILETLPPEAIPLEVRAKDLRDALRKIQQSLNKEPQAIRIIERSIQYLQTSLWLLPPSMPF